MSRAQAAPKKTKDRGVRANYWECCTCKGANLYALYRTCPDCDHRKCVDCNSVFIEQTKRDAWEDSALARTMSSLQRSLETPEQTPFEGISDDGGAPESTNPSPPVAGVEISEDLAPSPLDSKRPDAPQPHPLSAVETRPLPDPRKSVPAEPPPSSKATSTGRAAAPRQFIDLRDEGSASTSSLKPSSHLAEDIKSTFPRGEDPFDEPIYVAPGQEIVEDHEYLTQYPQSPWIPIQSHWTTRFGTEQDLDEDETSEQDFNEHESSEHLHTVPQSREAPKDKNSEVKESSAPFIYNFQIFSWAARGSLIWPRGAREPPLLPGMVRIRLLCSCQTTIWDDYPEHMRDAAKYMEADVNRFFRRTAPASPTSHGQGNRRTSLFDTISIHSLLGPFWRMFTRQRQQRRGNDMELESQARPGPSNTVRSTSFYLTCATRSSRIPALFQPAAESIGTDLEYFDLLRKIVNDHAWSLKGILNPRKITSIEYVKFELLFDNEHVEVRQRPGYPESKEDYQPCKDDLEAEDLCPWGPNTLLHFFERRHKCIEHPRILARIPKKLRQKLVVANDGKVLMGWGMHW